MGKIGDCCCCSADLLPDWNIDGFTKGAWSQYGDCCFTRTYTRSNLAEGIQYHFQTLYERSLVASVERDFTGWWVRQNWVPNGAPPVGSLYPTPMPNTCWNTYGVVATISYDREFEERSRQELQLQITHVYVSVHRVANSCTGVDEVYVRVSPVVRVSNRINTISYTRYTASLVADECYESVGGAIDYDTITGTKTFAVQPPIWSTSVQTASLYKYDSFEDIPDLLPVDIAVSPVESITEACFNGHVCQPQPPNPSPVCFEAPSFFPPGPYGFFDTLEEITDECILSQINLLTFPIPWTLCQTTEPIPSPTGDIPVAYCSVGCRLPTGGGALGCTGNSGIAFANSSISECDELVYNRILSSGFTGTGVHSIRRKASCSPLDIIDCDPYIDWWYGPKTYPVTNSFRDLSHTSTYTTPTLYPLCMSPTTFDLEV